MREYILNGKNMLTREDAHKELKTVLEFPEYYGANLDALDDCLAGFRGDITLINASLVSEALGEYGTELIEIFREHAAEGKLHFTIRFS